MTPASLPGTLLALGAVCVVGGAVLGAIVAVRALERRVDAAAHRLERAARAARSTDGWGRA